MKKIAYDSFQCDQIRILKENNHFVEVSAVLSRAGVYKGYPEGDALKSARELLKATYTANAAKVFVGKAHPDTLLVMSQKDMHGWVRKPYFDRDRIRATLVLDRDHCPPTFVESLRENNPQDVSIGFLYEPDFTPGIAADVNTKAEVKYDFVMRNILIDHIAIGVFKGRCSYPNCGIGVDTVMIRIGLDPFGEYSSMEDCIAKNKGKVDDPGAYCATIHHEITGKWPSEDVMSRVSKHGSEQMKESKDQEETYEKCIKDNLATGMTQKEAEEACKALKQADQAVPEEKTPLQQCIDEQLAAGKTQEEAEEFCKTKLAEPTADQEEPAEPTPMEKCVAEQMEKGKSAEEAEEWCRAELAGEHEAADTLIERSKQLIAMREQAAIEQRRAQRRHPI